MIDWLIDWNHCQKEWGWHHIVTTIFAPLMIICYHRYCHSYHRCLCSFILKWFPPNQPQFFVEYLVLPTVDSTLSIFKKMAWSSSVASKTSVSTKSSTSEEISEHLNPTQLIFFLYWTRKKVLLIMRNQEFVKKCGKMQIFFMIKRID